MSKKYVHETRWTTKNQVPRSFYGNYGPRPTGITLHHWGSDGQKFENVCDFLANNNVPTSAHYVVEDGRIATLASPEVATFHCGNAVGNGTTVGIELRPELIEPGDLDTLVQLIFELEQEYGNLKIYQHKDWFNTACAGRWGNKIPEIIERVNKLHAEKNAAVSKPSIVSTASNASKTIPTKESPVATARELWSYTNSKINGTKDTYALLTEAVQLLRKIAKKLEV